MKNKNVLYLLASILVVFFLSLGISSFLTGKQNNNYQAQIAKLQQNIAPTIKEDAVLMSTVVADYDSDVGLELDASRRSIQETSKYNIQWGLWTSMNNAYTSVMDDVKNSDRGALLSKTTLDRMSKHQNNQQKIEHTAKKIQELEDKKNGIER